MKLSELKDVNLMMKSFTTDVVKYQNFKTKKFIEKFRDTYTTYADKTLANYFDAGVTYINTKIKRKLCGDKFYGYIDEALAQCVQPLTPSIEDKRRIIKKNIS